MARSTAISPPSPRVSLPPPRSRGPYKPKSADSESGFPHRVRRWSNAVPLCRATCRANELVASLGLSPFPGSHACCEAACTCGEPLQTADRRSGPSMSWNPGPPRRGNRAVATGNARLNVSTGRASGLANHETRRICRVPTRLSHRPVGDIATPYSTSTVLVGVLVIIPGDRAWIGHADLPSWRASRLRGKWNLPVVPSRGIALATQQPCSHVRVIRGRYRIGMRLVSV
jgi:hypothetical protein